MCLKSQLLTQQVNYHHHFTSEGAVLHNMAHREAVDNLLVILCGTEEDWSVSLVSLNALNVEHKIHYACTNICHVPLTNRTGMPANLFFLLCTIRGFQYCYFFLNPCLPDTNLKEQLAQVWFSLLKLRGHKHFAKIFRGKRRQSCTTFWHHVVITSTCLATASVIWWRGPCPFWNYSF